MANFRSKVAQRIILVGALVNFLLAVGKIILGYIGHSQGLIADGVHSVADLLSDALVLFASRIGSQQADIDHPYGHRRIETAATVFLAVILIITGGGIIAQAIYEFIHPTKPDVHGFTLWVALVSIIANEILFRYTLNASQKIRSELLRAHAWHHRSDAASSLVVLVGIAGGLMGFYYLDGIAAIIVGFMVIKMGWDLGWSSLRELVDTGVDSHTLQSIERTIAEVPGVKAMHLLRNRSMGGQVLIDVHVQVDPHITVSEGHYIATQVHQELLEAIDNIEDVTVHIDPEEDQESKAIVSLLSRTELLQLLNDKLGTLDAYRQHREIRLHYLRGKLTIEILLPINYIANVIEIQQTINAATAELTFINTVKLLFEAVEEKKANVS
ncbi:MAG: cation transporter [Gammaproteobacteria bacterium]|jgi:cation diffusion facilitator family transporter|nr:cation transporter [Gammaproteobacteria bacterium]